MNTPPLISVIVPAHNACLTIGETLKSLYAQSLQNFEIILIDDASTDDLDKTLLTYQDPRLRVISLNKNSGVSAARNCGIEAAQSPYIAFCDADDVCMPQRLQQQWDFLESHPEIDICGSAFVCFDTQDQKIQQVIRHPLTHPAISQALMLGNCFGLSTVMLKTRLFSQLHFDEQLDVAEDYALWTQLVSKGATVANLDDVLVRYRLHSYQASRHKGKKLDQTTRRIRAEYCTEVLKLGNMPTDLLIAAKSIEEFVQKNSEFSHQDFRYLLTWLYQQSPRHELPDWWKWVRIQKYLELKLDPNYRFNTALLAILPRFMQTRYFDTLIKLKR